MKSYRQHVLQLICHWDSCGDLDGALGDRLVAPFIW
jgi:hypothetical protein